MTLRTLPECAKACCARSPQALNIEGGPAIGFDQRDDLAGQRAAGNQQQSPRAARAKTKSSPATARQWRVLVYHVIHMGGARTPATVRRGGQPVVAARQQLLRGLDRNRRIAAVGVGADGLGKLLVQGAPPTSTR
jgi:hypothetical protein